MTTAQTDQPTPQKPLRLWPGVVAAVLLWLARFGIKAVVPGFEGFQLSAIGGLLGALAVLVWWLFFSRARWSERVGAIVLMTLALGGTWQLKHESMGPFWLVGYGLPILMIAFVASAVASRGLPPASRRARMFATILIACGVWTLFRTDGINGDHVAEFGWRWSATPEERLVAGTGDSSLDSTPIGSVARPAPAAAEAPKDPLAVQPRDEPLDSTRGGPAAVAATSVTAETGPEWPGFRGPNRDGIIRDTRIETDWTRTPPKQLWRRPIGPGWSSFAVSGDLLYTQEQRGDEEVVACYTTTTGQQVWTHRDATRFFESNGGAGPRGTPTLSNGRIYTFGATGILNALDAGNGAVVWSRNAATDTDTAIPAWGFASSPLVIGDLVVVAVAGQLVGYDLASGNRRWLGPSGGESYSSPQLVSIGGVAQILLMSGARVVSVAPADGTLLWEHRWPGSTIVQPALTEDGDVLITRMDNGTRRIAVAHGEGGWTVEERWTSNGLKPYFNDFVVHKGHAFGFDGRILAALDLADGTRKWKGGRYGNGQLVLLRDQDVLLVLSEDGELALVEATPNEFKELARFPALEGKTWNHPVLVGGLLLVRNGEEMVAFRLPIASR